MLSRNNWWPFAAMLVVAAVLYSIVETRLSGLMVLDAKLDALDSRLGAIERSCERSEARLENDSRQLMERLEQAEGGLTLLGTKLADLDKNLVHFSSKLGSEEQTSKPGSIADRLDAVEKGFGTISQAVTTLSQDNTGRAEASDAAQARIIEQLAELRKVQEAEMASTREVSDLKGELAEVREQSEKTSADLRIAVDEVRKEISGAIENLRKAPAPPSSDGVDEGLADLTRGSKEPPAEPIFEVRAADGKTGMVVLNRGVKSGIKVGALFSVSREGEHIAFVKVVKVWDDYSGAEVIEVLAGNSVRVHDLVTEAPEKDLPSPVNDEPGSEPEAESKAPPPPPPAPPGG